MAEESSNPKGPTSEEISAAAFSGPAVYASRFSVTIGPGGLRLSALEQENVGAPLHFRAAIVTSIPQAIELRKLLERMLKELEIQLDSAMKEAALKKEVTEATSDG